MAKTKRLKLSWLFAFIFVAYFPVVSMDLTEANDSMQQQYGGSTSQNFRNIISMEPEYIKINIQRKKWHDYDPSGVYQHIPYYVKVFPEDIGTSRFIIQKQPFNEEWQLTEIYDKLWRRTIYSFPNTREERIEMEAQLKMRRNDSQKEKTRMKKTISNLNKEVTLVNEKMQKIINHSVLYLKQTIITKENQINLQNKTFEKEIILLKNINLENQKKISARQTQNQNLHVKFEKLQTSNKTLKIEITDLKFKNDNLKIQSKHLNEENYSLNTQNNYLYEERKNLMKTLTEEKAKFEKELETLNENFKSEIADLKWKNNNFKSENGDLKVQLKRLTPLYTQNNCLRKENKNLTQQLIQEKEICKKLEALNKNFKLEITDFKWKNNNLKSTNDDLKVQLEFLSEQTNSSNTKIDLFRKEITYLKHKIFEQKEKCKKLETSNKNFKSEIIDLELKNDNLIKSANDDLKLYSDLLNEYKDSLNDKINCFGVETKNLTQQLTEEKEKCKKLELSLKKEKTYQTFIKECESQKTSKTQQTINSLNEIKSDTYNLNKTMDNGTIMKDELNSKSFGKENQIDSDLKPQKFENHLEEKQNTIFFQPVSSLDQDLKKKNLEQKINASTNIFATLLQENSTKREKTYGNNLTQELSNSLETILVKNILNESHENIKNDENTLDKKIMDKCEDERKSIVLYATQKFENLEAFWIITTLQEPQIMPKISNILNNANNLKIDPNFQFEFALIYWGSIAYIRGEAKAYTGGKHNICKYQIYLDCLQKLEKKYENLLNNALENVKDPKKKVFLKCFLNNMKLFQEQKYHYESMLFQRGYLHEAPKKILEELKKV